MTDDHFVDRIEEGYLPVENARLYYRAAGQGQPVILLHGGPDFNHDYFLPEMDQLAETSRVIYYDQRGRGRSSGAFRPEAVSLSSEMEDLEQVCRHFQLDTTTVLGHSWGGLLALEYALRRPERVARLILMNTAPASQADFRIFRQSLMAMRAPGENEKLNEVRSSARYAEGDLDTEREYYQIHFRPTFTQPGHAERVLARLRKSFTQESVVQARVIEQRLLAETYLAEGYDLLPSLQQLRIPTLVLHAEHDLMPLESAAHIAGAIPGARLVVLKGVGHFAFVENTEAVCQEIGQFMAER